MSKRELHNHITRDIKPLGQCPACDRYHDSQIPKRKEASYAEELEEKLQEAISALEYYGGVDYGSDAYLEVFDCIKRTGDSTTEFDDLKFSARARATLDKLKHYKKEK